MILPPCALICLTSLGNLVSAITVSWPLYLPMQLSTQMPSYIWPRMTSVPKYCNTHLGVVGLPNFSLQKASGCSLHCLLASVSPSNKFLSQLNIDATASLRLLAKLSF